MTTNQEPATVSTLETSLGFRLGRAARAVRRAWEERIVDLGLTSPQANALRAVVEQPGISLRGLARKLGTDPMNAKRFADALEDAGLVTSCGDPTDQRRRALVPTDDGLRVAREVESRVLEWSVVLESIVGADDVGRLWAILARIEGGMAALTEASARPAPEATPGANARPTPEARRG